MNDFLAGLVGGTLGLVVGHPLDTVKAIMQTRDQRSMIQSSIKLFKKNQLKGFFRGLGLPFASYGPINSFIFGVYGNSLRLLEGKDVIDESKHPSSLSNIFIAGMISGFFTCFPNTPLELVKIQLQTHDKGEVKGVRDCIRNIIKNHGYTGLTRGFNSLVYRDAFSYGAYFYIFELIRREMKAFGSKNELLNDFIAGGISGAFTWTIVMPFDIVKSQVQSDMNIKASTREILARMYAKHGFRGYFVGTGPAAIRGFVVNSVTLCVYIQTLKFLNNQHHSTYE